jgi:hypothetical protein
VETAQDTEGLIEVSPMTDFRVVVTGPGVNIDRQTTQEAAWQVMSVLMGVGAAFHGAASPPQVAASPSGSFAATPSSSGPANLSVGEFISQVGAKTNTDKILAFGVYLHDHMGRELFTRDDVKTLFQRAKEPTPRNFPRDYGVAISSRWIAEADERNQFYVTVTGRKVVEQNFSEDVVKKTKPAPRPRRRAKGKDAGDEDRAGDAA